MDTLFAGGKRLIETSYKMPGKQVRQQMASKERQQDKIIKSKPGLAAG